LEGGQQIDGRNEQYANLSDGIDAMEFLARQLSGVQVSGRERSRRSANVSSVASAEERAAAREERAIARKEAGENFANKSAFLFVGFQYNGDLSDNIISYKGVEGPVRNSLFNISLGLSLDLPFRKK